MILIFARPLTWRSTAPGMTCCTSWAAARCPGGYSMRVRVMFWLDQVRPAVTGKPSWVRLAPVPADSPPLMHGGGRADGGGLSHVQHHALGGSRRGPAFLEHHERRPRSPVARRSRHG